MKALRKVLRDTLVGGIVFMLPFLVIALILGQALDVASHLYAPIVRAIPAFADYSVFGQMLLSIASLVLIALLSGVFVRTVPGQQLFRWLETSILGAIPQFATARLLVEGIADEELARVVMVPDDDTLRIGFAFQMVTEGWLPVYLPGAPDWRAGELILVDANKVIWPTVKTSDLTLLLGRLGADQRQSMADLQEMAAILTAGVKPNAGVAR